MPIFAWVVLWIAVFSAALVATEARRSEKGRWLTKPFASAGFIALALVLGAWVVWPTGYILLAALGLCFLGDLALIPDQEGPAFQAGVGAFALGHLGFVVAFLSRLHPPATLALMPLAVGSLLALAFGAAVMRILWPGVPAPLRGPTVAYVFVISAMVGAAAGTAELPGGGFVLAGAIIFYLSDLTVSFDRFKARRLVYRAVGLPMYYLAQVLLVYGLLGA